MENIEKRKAGRPKGYPKSGGRQKGSINKTSGDVKLWISGLLVRNLAQFENDLASLEPYQRLQIITGLIPYVAPKMSAVQAELDLGAMSEAQINTLIQNIVIDD